ncbi:MAG: sulfotransferase [Gemmatimonadota bacterium]|nr:sulfotransferase [Gemmatimonadota bacterium]
MTALTDRTTWFRGLMPGFLGIGAMRSGTTWLATQLRAHPQIQIERKEIHFFDRKLGERGASGSVRDLVNRLRYAHRVRERPPRRRLRGEITPAYATLDDDTVRRVGEWMPDTKIIYLMRDPVERTWSQVRNDFPIWIGREVEDLTRDELIEFFESDSVVARSDYAGCIERWRGVFGEDRVFVGFYDDIRGRPAGLLGDLFRFLEVDDTIMLEPGTLGRTVGSSDPVRMPDWVRSDLEARYSGHAARLAALGLEVPWTR